ncbi:hypothetical protein QYM36_002617, partial [Artemia franciscana]
MKDVYPKTDLIGVEHPDARQIRVSFKKLMRSCLPRNLVAGTVIELLDIQGASVLVALEDGWDATPQVHLEPSRWLDCAHNILQVAGTVIELLDIQGASVLVALEDGWDATPQ